MPVPAESSRVWGRGMRPFFLPLNGYGVTRVAFQATGHGKDFVERLATLELILARLIYRTEDRDRLAAVFHDRDRDIGINEVFREALLEVGLQFLCGHAGGVDASDQRK